MTDITPGTVIVLNGCMSAGKASIAKAIQRMFDAPYLRHGSLLVAGLPLGMGWCSNQ